MIRMENMWRLSKYKFDVADIARKIFASYKRLFLLLLGICTFFYILPPVFRYLFWSTPERKGKFVNPMLYEAGEELCFTYLSMFHKYISNYLTN